jgi:hypothetical protein
VGAVSRTPDNDATTAWDDDGAAGAPTTVHEPASGTDTALAYSEAIEIPEPARSRVPVVLFIVAAVALAVAVAGLFLIEPTPAAPVPTPAVQSAQDLPSIQGEPAATEPTPDTDVTQAIPDLAETMQPPTPVPVAAPPGGDDVFFEQLSMAGILIKDHDAAIETGHDVCQLLSQGHSESDIVSHAVTLNRSLTVPNAAALVSAAVIAYCPQYANRIGG